MKDADCRELLVLEPARTETKNGRLRSFSHTERNDADWVVMYNNGNQWNKTD